MLAKNALISGDASVSSSPASWRRVRSRLLAEVTIAGPVTAAAFTFLRGGRSTGARS
jgi:hypothetical protein